MSRADDMIKRSDTDGLLRAALNAAFSDERCECVEPDLHGRDLMCGHCLRENQGQRDRAQARISEPHPFELSERPAPKRLGWCAVCARTEDDPRHSGFPRSPVPA